MSVSNLNAFQIHEISINMNSIKFAVLIVGLLKFLLLQILLHRKRILSLFTAMQSPISDDDETEVEQKVDDARVCAGEVEAVLRSLGIFYCREKIPASLDIDQIIEMFEEREPSLDEVREAFDVFDDNRDGFIDEKELQRVLCALGFKEGLEMENCRRMVERFDEDGDGRIDFDEFVKFLENSFN